MPRFCRRGSFYPASSPALAQKSGGVLKIEHRIIRPAPRSTRRRPSRPSCPSWRSTTTSWFSIPQSSRTARPHRARARDELDMERRRHQAHLQAARRREVARRQALHQRRRECTWDMLIATPKQAAQEPAQGLVVQPQGGDGQRRPRGHLPSRPAAALGADHARRRHFAGLSLPRPGRADAHQADRHRARSSSPS